MAEVPERYLVARGPKGTIECAVKANGSLEAKEFLSGAQCRRHLGAILTLFQTIVDQAADDAEIGPKALKKTVIHEFIKGQVRIFCYRDGTSWVLTHGDLKKSNETPRANIDRAERIMEEDQRTKRVREARKRSR
jgi:hypothetical protein